MDEATARKLLQEGTTNVTAGTAAGQTGAGAAYGQFTPAETFAARNYQGLPIDVEEGLPTMTRVGVQFRKRPEDQVSYLEGIYGKGNVRLADNGMPLVKVVGADNKPKEVPMSQPGLQWADVPRAAAYIPETAGAILGLRSGRALPLLGKIGQAEEAGVGAKALGFMRDVAAESVGQETAGAAKEIGTSAIDQQPVDVERIIKQHAEAVPFNMAVAGGMGITGKVLGRVITPFSGEQGALDKDVFNARQYFKEKYGVEYPLTIGEETGSRIAKRVESTMAKLPGSSPSFQEMMQEKTDKIKRILNGIAGLPEDITPAEKAAFPTEEQVGQNAINAIRAKVDPMERAVEIAKNDVSKAAHNKIMSELESSTMADRQLYPEKVGESIRARAVQLRGEFQAESKAKYEEAYSLPGGRDRILNAPNLAKDAQEAIDSLPPKDQITEVSSPILGPKGEAITHTITGKEANREFVPSGVLGKLKSLSELKEQKFSLQDLVNMRTDVSNDIAQGEAIPGVQTHYLSKIRDMLTKSINEATAQMPDGNLKAAWENANEFYAKEVGKFHEWPVARLFKDIESKGFVADEDIIRNIGPTEYGVFKKFLGENSPEFGKLKRAILDKLVSGSTPVGQELIDGKSFMRDLANFYRNNRSIADDILGTKEPTGFTLQGVTKPSRGARLDQLGEILASEDSRLDANQLLKAIDQGEPLYIAVQRLRNNQANLDKIYRSQIIKDIADRKLGDSFDATEFINRFYSKASPAELREVVTQLQDNPLTLSDLRQKVVERTLYDAQRAIKETDPSTLGPGELFRPSDTAALDKIFGGPSQRERLQILLGNKTYEDLVQMGKLLRSGEVTERAFASAGGLAATMQITQSLRGGVVSYMADWAKQKLAALLITRPELRWWVGNRLMSRADQGKLADAFIESTPLAEAISNDFGDRGAQEFLAQMKRSVQLYQKYGGNTGNAPETPQAKEKRLRELLRK